MAGMHDPAAIGRKTDGAFAVFVLMQCNNEG
jgi:hypothetical protein